MSFLSSSFNVSTLKSLPKSDLQSLCAEIRTLIIEKMAEVGGHVGPNVGIVETATALHYVFDSPNDKIIWDVSHQSIPHKILTGRFEQFKKFHSDGGVSAFTNTTESEHDHFNVGHTSTSVSLAAGLAAGRDHKAKRANSAENKNADERVIAVIGDGSLSGGEAFEGLNIAANVKGQLLIIVNDNEMSIDYNSGGLYSGLQKLRETNGKAENNIFTFLGLDYFYLENGNDVEKLVEVFEKVKDVKRPTVLHIHTKKGLGVKWAEEKPNLWHYHAPFSLEDGEFTTGGVDNRRALIVNSVETTIDFLEKEALENNAMIVIPGSPLLGTRLQETVPENYYDVGIAEQSAVAFASAAAKNVKPYMVIASTFLQRAYDQILQDWALNSNPATLIVLGAAIASSDYTHIGVYDIPLLSNIPNLVYLAPSCDNEYRIMLEWAKKQKFPTAIRLSGGTMCSQKNRDLKDIPKIVGEHSSQKEKVSSYNFKTSPVIPVSPFTAKSELFQKGEEVAFIGVGWFFQNAVKSASEFEKKFNKKPTIVNQRFLTHLDEELLKEIAKNHRLIITFEDGQVDGGIGQKISAFICSLSNSNCKVINLGAKKEFVDSVPYDSLLERYGLKNEQILEKIETELKVD